MKLGLKIEEHDLTFKIKHIKEFLNDGNKVKVIVMFKGRGSTPYRHGRKTCPEDYRVSERCRDDGAKIKI
jgi:bacterial translation initiation factor 3 (bIF-3)